MKRSAIVRLCVWAFVALILCIALVFGLTETFTTGKFGDAFSMEFSSISIDFLIDAS